MARVAPILRYALLAVVAGCAAGPRQAVPPLPLVPPESPGAVIELTLQRGGFLPGLPPAEVWFARVAALNGSDCAPREARFDPALDRATDLGSADSGGMAMMGALEGGSIPGDPTCLYDETGAPVWEPILYRADRIEGIRAYLDAPPPARYVAVAATFVTDARSESTATVYFPAWMVAATESALPPGAAVPMGRYVVAYGASGPTDPAQNHVAHMIEPLGPSGKALFAQNIIAGLAGQPSRSVLHKAALVRAAQVPETAAAPGPAGIPDATDTAPPAPEYPW